MKQDETLASEYLKLKQSGTPTKQAYNQLCTKYDKEYNSIRWAVYRGLKIIAPVHPTTGVETLWNTNSDIDYITAGYLESDRNCTFVHLSDIHEPFHDITALMLMVKYIWKLKPNYIIIGSDEWDCPDISSYKKMRDYDASNWLKKSFSFHDVLVTAIRANSLRSKIIWINGNHETRLLDHVDELSSLREIAIDSIIDRIKSYERVYYTDKSFIRFGEDLLITHGHLYSKHTAEAMLNSVQYQISVLAGHTHREDSKSVQGILKRISCTINGYLGLPEFYNTTPSNIHTLGSGFARTIDGEIKTDAISIIRGNNKYILTHGDNVMKLDYKSACQMWKEFETELGEYYPNQHVNFNKWIDNYGKL